jgi:hypothetical protein
MSENKTKKLVNINNQKMRVFCMLILVGWEVFISFSFEAYFLGMLSFSPGRLELSIYFFASLDLNELWNIVSWADYQPTSSWLWVPCLTTTRLPVCQGAWKLNETIFVFFVENISEIVIPSEINKEQNLFH